MDNDPTEVLPYRNPRHHPRSRIRSAGVAVIWVVATLATIWISVPYYDQNFGAVFRSQLIIGALGLVIKTVAAKGIPAITTYEFHGWLLLGNLSALAGIWMCRQYFCKWIRR